MKRKDKASKYAIYTGMTIPSLKAREATLKDCAQNLIAFIESIPDEIADAFPTMPGIDRDWADEVLYRKGSTLPKPELSRHVVELQDIAEALMEYIEAIPADDYDDFMHKQKAALDEKKVSMGNFAVDIETAIERY